LDSNIFHQISNENNDLINEIKNHHNAKNIFFHLIKIISHEWTNLEKRKHKKLEPGFEKKFNRMSYVENLLHKIGKTSQYSLTRKQINRGKELFESEKFTREYDEKPLEKNDCFLCIFTLDNSFELITADETLKRAVEELAKKESSNAKVFVPKSYQIEF